MGAAIPAVRFIPKKTSALWLCFLAAACSGVVAAQQAAQRDPQALLLASQSVTAMAGTTVISDATVSANVSYTAGSDQESGTATLEAKGTLESRVSLSLSGGSRLEVRNSTGMPTFAGMSPGEWSGPDGVLHAESLHNCWTDAAWFFPALGALSAVAGDGTISAAYVGLETHNGTPAQHVRFSRVLAGQNTATTQTVSTLSTEDVYLDPVTALPLAIDFNGHPDSDLGTNIAVEIVFANYQLQKSGELPFHVQKYFNGTLMLDLALSAVRLNSGLPDSDFAITVTPN